VIARLLFARVHSCGVKVVLCGDGSDELFGGYEMYRQPEAALRQRLFQHKLRNLGRTELQRVNGWRRATLRLRAWLRSCGSWSACLRDRGPGRSSHWSMLNMPSGTPAISIWRQIVRHCGSSW
jgi:hypothetical protein